MKSVENSNEWSEVTEDLEAEVIKIQTYDWEIFQRLDLCKHKQILDYGSGPGVFAQFLLNNGANVFAYDPNEDLRIPARSKLGDRRVFDSVDDIPDGSFDAILCNLVLCIIDDQEVESVLTNILAKLTSGGEAFIGFCNPKIFRVGESRLDFRFPSGANYHTNHQYEKVKKEGGYKIIEWHRPIQWYETSLEKHGFEIAPMLYTPHYDFKGSTIRDFVIFQVRKPL